MTLLLIFLMVRKFQSLQSPQPRIDYQTKRMTDIILILKVSRRGTQKKAQADSSMSSTQHAIRWKFILIYITAQN